MKKFLQQTINKIKGYSKKLDNHSMLMDKHWVVIDEIQNSKLVYIFRRNNQLIISRNGRVEKGKWENIGDDSLLIEKPDGDFLFRHGFFDDTVLALKVDGVDEYALLLNQTFYEKDINSMEKVIQLLEKKYYWNGKELGSIPKPKPKSEPKKISKPVLKNINEPPDKDVIEKRVLKKQNGKYGFVDGRGEEKIGFLYDWAEDFIEDLALVRLDGKFGFIDFDGKIIIKIMFDGASSFKNGKANVNLNGMQLYIDKLGNQL